MTADRYIVAITMITTVTAITMHSRYYGYLCKYQIFSAKISVLATENVVKSTLSKLSTLLD